MIKFNAMRRKLPILKRLIPSAKKLFCRLFWRDGYGTVRSNGVLFRLNYKNFVDRQIAFYDDFEDHQMAYLTNGMKEIGADTFLDIGANIGFYSIILAKKDHIENIIAFEPDHRNVSSFEQNILLNGLTGRIILHQLAVSAQAGELRFQPGSDNSTGQSKVTDKDAGSVSVHAIAIDEFLNIADRSLGIKIDVEGHELDVIKGMMRTLKSNDCLLQIEIYGDNIPMVTDCLSEIGYFLKKRIDHDHFFSR